MQSVRTVTMEFHISRGARDSYQFDQRLFSLQGNVVFANFHAARVFAQKMNEKRDLVMFPERAVKAGQINAMGLIDEILHYVVELYRQQENPRVMGEALEWLEDRLGKEVIDKTLQKFADEFPPLAVYRQEIEVGAYLSGESNGIPNRLIVFEELLLLWLANVNPAFSPFIELFDDASLDKYTAYHNIIEAAYEFFEEQPKFGPEHENLIDMLRSPAIAEPYSLSGQLEFIRRRWGSLLGGFLFRLLRSLDFVEEENKASFLGAGPSRVYDFSSLGREPERFSPDREWMPSLVLLAKNAFVWLDQLSKRYQEPIHRLDQIPDEELKTLARWGFSGLWLIGLWERSEASKEIKQLRGNPDAVASAYSLFNYNIAADLGGDEAYNNLRERAWQHGIRLASDMVPNHMGIDSRWVIEHPDWFISLDYSPFPSYSFNGPNLSWDGRVGLYIEDHYYDSTDAAVVFKRIDNWSGDTRYIYHGNDGTSMPWNDTAQLNYLIPEVREAVIQTILHVARKFPVIRFDAAMTLAKKHFQRLWFPDPGTGGAIPTRAEHGLTKEEFDRVFPKEFWREVVDRVAAEVPDTLLLAEAFWLMEGYFVRTLGMHRVYNSAFMNMLRDEKNQEYRLVIKNTLEFDPEILKRYVNFMNNPDERTAVDQFGKGDKYFGICTVMATMPGLPMFGHGQVQGFSEKYGMEFRRAYWDEQPDQNLIDRHEREIFPLLRQRYLFAEVENFLLYDLFTPDGHVNEDVFAYSNRSGDQRSLVVYHNKFGDTQGWIRSSAAFSVKPEDTDERRLERRSLGEGLGLQNKERHYVIFRDHLSGMEYIRNNKEIYEQGLHVRLDAYKAYVFLDFREVEDNELNQYAQLTDYLDGRGVPNIEEAMREIVLQPVLYPFRELINPGMLRYLIDNCMTHAESKVSPGLFQEVEQKTVRLLREINTLIGTSAEDGKIDRLVAEIRREVQAVIELPVIEQLYPKARSRDYHSAAGLLNAVPNREVQVWGALFGWVFTHSLGAIAGDEEVQSRSRSWIDEWLFGKLIASALQELGLDEYTAWRSVQVVKLFIVHHDWHALKAPKKKRAYLVLQNLLRDEEVQNFIQVNRYQGVLWFNQEAFDELLRWMLRLAVVETLSGSEIDQQEIPDRILAHYQLIKKLQKALKESDFKVEGLLEAARS